MRCLAESSAGEESMLTAGLVIRVNIWNFLLLLLMRPESVTVKHAFLAEAHSLILGTMEFCSTTSKALHKSNAQY